MLVLGLTGPTGSGKGVVGRILAAENIPCLDTDAVYHELISAPSACTEELKAHFGETIVTACGAIDRKKLADIVFGDTQAREERLSLLNRITHHYVLDTCRHWLRLQEREGKRAAVIDAPLLFESGFHEECDYVIAVLAQRQTRLARILLRDGITEEAAERRIAAQPNDAFYTEKADFIIQNNGEIKAVEQDVLQVLRQLSIR